MALVEHSLCYPNEINENSRREKIVKVNDVEINSTREDNNIFGLCATLCILFYL